LVTGNFIEINNQFCRLLGYSQQEMKDKNFQSITHPDDLFSSILNLKKMLIGEIKEYNLEKDIILNLELLFGNLSVSALLKRRKIDISSLLLKILR
jgi:PAS domain S-box-containing protein